MKSHRYDIQQAAQEVAAGKTTYRKRVEIMTPVEVETSFFGNPYKIQKLEGTGKFEMREVSKAEFYA